MFPKWKGSGGYNYLCNQCLSPLKLWVRIPLRRVVLDTTLCGKVWRWLVTVWWFSPGTPVSSTNKTVCHNITEVLLKVIHHLGITQKARVVHNLFKLSNEQLITFHYFFQKIKEWDFQIWFLSISISSIKQWWSTVLQLFEDSSIMCSWHNCLRIVVSCVHGTTVWG